MGLFDSGNNANDAADRSNQLMEQQLRQNQAELEQKRQSLYRERLDIIKSQGAQQFIADRSSPVAPMSGAPRPKFDPNNPFGG